MSAELLSFPEETVGDIVDRADAIAPSRVMIKAQEHFAEASRLDAAGDHGSQFLRHLITVGRLMERAIIPGPCRPQEAVPRGSDPDNREEPRWRRRGFLFALPSRRYRGW